jgi:hypothetical protein
MHFIVISVPCKTRSGSTACRRTAHCWSFGPRHHAGGYAVVFLVSVDVVIVPNFANVADWKQIVEGIDIVIHLAGVTHAATMA